MLDTISLLEMMSMVLLLSRSSQLGGRLLNLSSDICENKKWSSALVLKYQHLSTSILCTCLLAPSLASTDLVAPPPEAFSASSAARFTLSFSQPDFKCPSFWN